MEIEYKWLPHLEGAVPKSGQGKRISTYTVALEGWRRGLKLKFYSVFEDKNKLKIRYSLENESKIHHFSLSMGDHVSDKAFEICDDKELTKHYLSKHNVPVPKGAMFDPSSSDQEIIEYGVELGFPLVVKPTDGNGGKGVFANINSKEELQEIVPHVRNDLAYKNIIVESYVSGEEYRIYVIEDKVLGAMNRRPANVLGDGIHTIRELIHTKNSMRKLNPHLTSRLIKIDREINILLEDKGYDLNTIPQNGEIVNLREKSNLSTGGEAVDVTELLTEELKNIAINAGKAIPGLKHYGVDMIVSNDHKNGVILEVNSRPGLGGHLFPGEGEPRDFAKEIIDYYFPETKDIERTSLYFDFDGVLEPIKSRTAYNVDVTTAPLGKLYGKQYIITGNFSKRELRSSIRREAHKNYMYGYTELTDDENLLITIVTLEERKLDKFKNKLIESYEVNILEENDWNKPVRIGFENKDSINLTKKEIKKLIIENEKLTIENERILIRYNRIKHSKAWRITYPVRSVLHRIKLFFRTLT